LRIMLDILNAVREEGNAKPTHILYRANLSHDRLTKYLDELVAKGLIEVRQQDEGNRYYSITPKGVSFLVEIRKAQAFVEGFGIPL
jgi:predicted transcriptional regulator